MKDKELIILTNILFVIFLLAILVQSWVNVRIYEETRPNLKTDTKYVAYSLSLMLGGLSIGLIVYFSMVYFLKYKDVGVIILGIVGAIVVVASIIGIFLKDQRGTDMFTLGVGVSIVLITIFELSCQNYKVAFWIYIGILILIAVLSAVLSFLVAQHVANWSYYVAGIIMSVIVPILILTVIIVLKLRK